MWTKCTVSENLRLNAVCGKYLIITFFENKILGQTNYLLIFYQLQKIEICKDQFRQLTCTRNQIKSVNLKVKLLFKIW